MSKIAKRRIEASTPYTPTPRRTFNRPLEAADEAIGDLRLATRVVSEDHGDGDAVHVLVRSTEVLADVLAQLRSEKGAT